MAKFILLYKGDATEAKDMDPEDSKAIMEKWGQWMEEIGSSLIDVGAPMDKHGASIIDDGSEGNAELLTGYSIIKAEDIEEAKKLCERHPFLSDKTGKFSVEIYELLPVPGM